MKLLLSALALAAGVSAQSVAPIVSYATPEQAVAGQFIVVFEKAAVQEYKQAVAAIRRQRVAGLSIDTVSQVNVNDKFLALSGEFSSDQVEALRRLNGVKYLEQVAVFRAFDTEAGLQKPEVQKCQDVEGCTWGLDRIDQESLPLDQKYHFAETAEDVDVYVIDTGVNTRAEGFEGRASHGTCFDLSGNENPLAKGCGTDCQGHGTHVAGTIADAEYGVAKNANIIGVKTLSCIGFGSSLGTLNSIAWVADAHAKSNKKFAVANMSLGGPFSQASNDAIAAGSELGVVYVVAAGNENQDACNVSPASAPAAMTVGATDKFDNLASFSNWGSCVDILAPGVDIRSLNNAPWENDAVPKGTKVYSGTSMASPNAAGAVALTIGEEGEAAFADVPEIIARQIEKATPGKISPKNGTPDELIRTYF